MQHLCAQAVESREANIGTVLGRIDMDVERAFAEWRSDNLLQSYIDVVVHGGLEYGPDIAREIIETKYLRTNSFQRTIPSSSC